MDELIKTAILWRQIISKIQFEVQRNPQKLVNSNIL